MSNIVPVQGGAYSNLYAEQPSSAASSNEGAGFSNMMGQVAGSGLALTPNVAQSLMQRSMTTGVPKAEMDLYGGYDAVKAMFDAQGGSYSTQDIPAAQKQQLAMQVAATGVGNFALPASEHISVSPAVLQTMAANGIDVGTINTIQQNATAPFVDSTSYIDSLMDSLGSNATAKKS